jgi:hypothetical protein
MTKSVSHFAFLERLLLLMLAAMDVPQLFAS